MIYAVKLLPAVHIDLRQARQWYNEQSENLGDDFKAEVNAEITYIANNPDSYQIKFNTLRQSLVNRFPYAIYYMTDDEKQLIIIFGILHTKRNPKTIIKRTSK